MSELPTALSGARPVRALWNRIPLVIRAIVVGLLVAEVGIGAWVVLLLATPPWVAPWAMPALLVLYWLFFSGRWF